MATASACLTRGGLHRLLRSSWQLNTSSTATSLVNTQVHPLSTSRLLHTTARVAAGHSHWHNIQHKKGRKDAARSAKFSKIGKAIVDCVRRGGVDGNPRLTSIIDNAKAQSFPRERIESAINRGLGKTDNPLIDVMHEITVGGGVGILLECHTDSKARTHADIQRALKKTNGHHVPNKSILFNFERRAAIHLPPQHISEELADEIFLAVADVGATDLVKEEVAVIHKDDDPDLVSYHVYCDPKDVMAVKEALNDIEGLEHNDNHELEYHPIHYAEVTDPDVVESNYKTIHKLEELADLTTLTHNMVDASPHEEGGDDGNQ